MSFPSMTVRRLMVFHAGEFHAGGGASFTPVVDVGTELAKTTSSRRTPARDVTSRAGAPARNETLAMKR
ncbi:MAG: hypothetical protein ACF8CQ_00670 [Rhodopirellula sp. JB044]|uniref:hypothetical protein n=1 Tax=Rhodopirellula sp. JB044 TaxID=3342844 RepID=UPI00370B5AFB